MIWGVPSQENRRWLAGSAGTVWLLSGLLVLHPQYRELSHVWLDPLLLPEWILWVSAAVSIGIGGLVFMGRTGAITWIQVAILGVYSLIWAALDPWLLVHPFGSLSKNIPFLAVIVANHRLAIGAWDRSIERLLLGSVALVWVLQGLFPKVLFQRPLEIVVVENSGWVSTDPLRFVVFFGIAQVLCGLGVWFLKPEFRRWLLGAQALSLVVAPIFLTAQDPTLWLHPYAPLIKNVPFFAATVVLLRQ